MVNGPNQPTAPRRVWLALPLLALGLGLAGGCSGPKLMPTPNVYRQSDVNPFSTVPPWFQTNEVDLLYVTDRVRETRPVRGPAYTANRSDRLVYGSARVRIGEGLDWDRLVQESLSVARTDSLPLRVRWVAELGELPNPRLVPELTPAGLAPRPQFYVPASRAVSVFQQEVARRLELTPRKEAFVYVHGFNNDFDWAMVVAAQLWHFLPREGVPIVYTWPAGRGGLRGYTYDRESSEFTVYHCKQLLRALAACPGVEKVHLIAHSRGADVAASAVRELLLEARGADGPVVPVAKIENLVLVAPDLDLEVSTQRIAAEWVPLSVGRLTVYVSEKDRAIGLANWLFEGIRRLGQIRAQDFSESQKLYMRRAESVQFIDARVKGDFFGHGYFHSNPAVSSDLLQLLRHNCGAGTAERPLPRDEELIWRITDDYFAPFPR